MATCPTCNRRLPKPRKPKARPLEPWENLVAGISRFATFALPTPWPSSWFGSQPRYVGEMQPGILRLRASGYAQ